MYRIRRFALTAVAVGAALAGGALAHAGQQAAAVDQPNLVEDYSYPGAADIQTTQGITLVSGDGHIVSADCATPATNNVSVIQVHSTDPIGADKSGRVCFRVTAASGQLTLKIPNVYSIRGDGQAQGSGHKLKADVTTGDGTHTTVDVKPDGTTQVGIGTSPTADPTTLVQLTASS